MFVRVARVTLGPLVVAGVYACFSVTGTAQTAPTFKVAYWNVFAGKGAPAIDGHPVEFVNNHNCTDPTQPMNASGIGLVQSHLISSLGNDPRVIALGLGEAWFCGSPERVRAALGWKAASSELNGVSMVARHGFVGPEEWVQLDTSLNPNPIDTMWVLRRAVCMDAGCTQTINVFVAHWMGMNVPGSLERQAEQTVDFLKARGGTTPHVFVGDLNTWEGVPVCSQVPEPGGLPYLRNAGYIDAWPAIHGAAEGYTGMVNRANCGVPMGYPFKRIDYAWSPPGFPPLWIERFGVVPPGDGAPSDHYGIVAEYPWPGAVPPPDSTPPAVRVTSPAEGTIVRAAARISVAATDASGIGRVEILEDDRVAHTFAEPPHEVLCDHLWRMPEGTHTIQARAVDRSSRANSALSPAVRVTVQRATASPGEIVLRTKDASALAGTWRLVNDATAAGGTTAYQPDAGAPKIAAPLAAPRDYFELTFNAEAGKPYRLWLRGRADRDFYYNDSVHVQFSGSVTQSGAPDWRIGSTSATVVVLEDCGGCPLNGWGWQDNGYGRDVLGPLVYFAATGPQTIRVQAREDGIAIDQIVISSQQYLTRPPGSVTGDGTIVPVPVATRDEILVRASSAVTLAGAWRSVADATAAGGVAVTHPNAYLTRIDSPLANPAHFVEFTFDADAGRQYRLWMRSRADADLWNNDSVHVQFSGTVTSAGAPIYRIGTTSAMQVNLEDGPNIGVVAWGWQDNGYGAGVLGPLLTFETGGRQTIRIQTREDGLRIDQIVLSSRAYVTTAPGALHDDRTIIPW